ncbi:MAG: FMN-binding protein [Sandaracinus sp.]|nr:FMN-binding protein [Sandaracinus sp.]
MSGRVVLVVASVLVLAASARAQHGTAPTRMDCARMPCAEVLPGALRFEREPPPGTTSRGPDGATDVGYAVGYAADGSRVGWVALSNELVDVPAYSGKPVVVLFGLDESAAITGARVIHHAEPILLAGIPEAQLTGFVAWYVGHRADESISVGQATRRGGAVAVTREVDGEPQPQVFAAVDVISGATVTALAANRTILDAAPRRPRGRNSRSRGPRCVGVSSRTGRRGLGHAWRLKASSVDSPSHKKTWACRRARSPSSISGSRSPTRPRSAADSWRRATTITSSPSSSLASTCSWCSGAAPTPSRARPSCAAESSIGSASSRASKRCSSATPTTRTSVASPRLTPRASAKARSSSRAVARSIRGAPSTSSFSAVTTTRAAPSPASSAPSRHPPAPRERLLRREPTRGAHDLGGGLASPLRRRDRARSLALPRDGGVRPASLDLHERQGARGAAPHEHGGELRLRRRLPRRAALGHADAHARRGGRAGRRSDPLPRRAAALRVVDLHRDRLDRLGPRRLLRLGLPLRRDERADPESSPIS